MSNESSPSPPPPQDPSSDPSPPSPPKATLALPAPPLASSPNLPTATVVTPNPRRLPPPCWSPDETVALIDAYRDKWYALRRGNLKATHWQEVAEAVSQRCPTASPPKTAVQCRHKMEKLRKRYRTEIQRARSMPLSRFSSSWVHFKRMDTMEKGPNAKPDYRSESADEDNDDDDDDDDQDQEFYVEGYKNGGSNTRSVQKLYRNGIGNSGGSAGSSGGGAGGFRIRIPTGVSIAQPAPRFYGKVDQKYSGSQNANLNPSSTSNTNARANFGGSASGSGFAARIPRGFDETGGKSASGKRERDPMAEMVSAIKLLGDGFVRMEQMKMDMAREIETMRMDMEMKRTEMILDSQQRIVEAFAKAFSERKKKPKRMPTPES